MYFPAYVNTYCQIIVYISWGYTSVRNMEDVDPGMVNEGKQLDEGLRILARLIARRHLAMTDAQSDKPSDGEEVNDNHS